MPKWSVYRYVLEESGTMGFTSGCSQKCLDATEFEGSEKDLAEHLRSELGKIYVEEAKDSEDHRITMMFITKVEARRIGE